MSLQIADNIVVVDFISEVVDSIRDTNSILSVTPSGTVYEIGTPDTKNLSNNDYVTIGGVSYQVGSVTPTSFEIEADVTGELTWKADAPYYYYGTPVATGNLRDLDLQTENIYKYPFIALFEPFDQRVDMNNNEILYKDVDLWMVFMTYNNHPDWNTSDHYEDAIKPMQDVLYRFINELVDREGSDIMELDNYTQTNHAKWGLVAKFTGHTKEVFNEHLSGVELKNLNIKLIKKFNNCQI